MRLDSKTFLAFLLALTIISTGCFKSKNVVTKVGSASRRSPKLDGVTYALPRTVIQARIPFKRRDKAPGEFEQYAPCFFPLDIAAGRVRAEETAFSIGVPILGSRGEPDPNERYIAKIKGGYFENKTLFLGVAATPIPGEELEAGPAAPGNDPFLQAQWAARITQADQAWQIVSGSREIRIAILDEGVDTSHPDLRDAIVASFDAVEGHVNQQPNPWDSHGTACAGLAAAIPNNNVGLRGIGGGCSLMPVRIAFSPNPIARWTWVESNVIRGIDWAWRNGAHVLSNSWVGGPPSNGIEAALDRARRLARGGRGCVVLMAAGNDSGPVAFPANLSNVLAISASNELDQPKTRNSADGESWWGSNFGPEVDLAAPGVHNFTTDIVGQAGDNPGGALNADYVNNFNGTSSATPIVAGVAALVLSVNPNLTEAQVRRLLTQTADKVGAVIYTNGRNNQMGQGRVNALRAVRVAPTFV